MQVEFHKMTGFDFVAIFSLSLSCLLFPCIKGNNFKAHSKIIVQHVDKFYKYIAIQDEELLRNFKSPSTFGERNFN